MEESAQVARAPITTIPITVAGTTGELTSTKTESTSLIWRWGLDNLLCLQEPPTQLNK